MFNKADYILSFRWKSGPILVYIHIQLGLDQDIMRGQVIWHSSTPSTPSWSKSPYIAWRCVQYNKTEIKKEKKKWNEKVRTNFWSVLYLLTQI